MEFDNSVAESFYSQFKIQDIEKDPKVIHSIERELPLEVLFYRNLWLEAKAALHMKLVSQTDTDKNKGYFLYLNPENLKFIFPFKSTIVFLHIFSLVHSKP